MVCSIKRGRGVSRLTVSMVCSIKRGRGVLRLTSDMLAILQICPRFKLIFIRYNCIGSVMVSVLASSAVDRRITPKTMKLVFVVSPLSTQH